MPKPFHAAFVAPLLGGLILTALPAQQGRSYGRSNVISQQGIVATSQTLASQAGAQILSKGGSAVDAAIAANAVLGVTEPLMTGLGGDLFVIYWDAKTGKLTGLNSSGAAPQALTPELLAKQGIKTMPGNGIHSAQFPEPCAAGTRCISATANCLGRIFSSPPSPSRNKAFPCRKACMKSGPRRTT